jgi:hypothetical protein
MSDPARASKRPLLRTWIREFVVIVLGVLVALSVDDWNQGRIERQRERVDLRQLLMTTRENESRIVDAIGADSGALAASARLLAALASPDPLPSADSLAAWRTEAFRFSVFFPMTGTYAAIAQTGDLNLIRSDSLRAEIATYAGVLDGTARQLDDWTATFHRNAAEVIRTAPIDRIRALVRNDEASATGWRSEALERGLFMQTIISSNRVMDLRDLLDATRALRRSLEAELGEHG